MTSSLTLSAARPASRALPSVYWTLRIGAALCFIGHGAFGFITKAAWVPYFDVVGIPEAWAWRLMPIVGAVDVLAAMAVLFAPRGLPLAYMTVWAVWTALLRPLSGEPVWETLERAGNYGVPLALLALTGLPRSWRELWPLREQPLRDLVALARVRVVLTWTTALLLFGHGALGAFSTKASLTSHYALLGLPASTTVTVGWLEIALAAAIAARPLIPLLIVAMTWKLATESLWIAAGAPIWEFVERAGSYAAPLALAALVARERVATTQVAGASASARNNR